MLCKLLSCKLHGKGILSLGSWTLEDPQMGTGVGGITGFPGTTEEAVSGFPWETLTVRIPPSWLFSRKMHLLLTSEAQTYHDRETGGHLNSLLI